MPSFRTLALARNKCCGINLTDGIQICCLKTVNSIRGINYTNGGLPPVRYYAGATHNWPDTKAAWQIYEYGGINKLTLSKSLKVQPIVKTTDVLVKVHAASVNPIDVMMMGKLGVIVNLHVII